MNNRQLMLAAISNGLEDDATTGAALDAIREESGCSLLAAVVEVARVWKAARDDRDISEARTSLSPSSAIRELLTESILAECHGLPPGATAYIVVVGGPVGPGMDSRPSVTDDTADGAFIVSVGALWVKREASRILLERDRAARRPRSRRSR